MTTVLIILAAVVLVGAVLTAGLTFTLVRAAQTNPTRVMTVMQRAPWLRRRLERRALKVLESQPELLLDRLGDVGAGMSEQEKVQALRSHLGAEAEPTALAPAPARPRPNAKQRTAAQAKRKSAKAARKRNRR